MKILHIDTEKGWRGGQQQAVYLFTELIKNGYDTTFVCPPNSRLHSYFSLNKLPCKTIRYRGELDILSGYLLASYAKKTGYQLLHLHSAHSLAWGIWAKLFNPHLILVAARRVNVPIRKNFFSLFKYRTKLLNKIIAVSDSIRNVLLRDGIPEEKITVIHSGIDPKKFVLDAREGNFLSPQTLREQWHIPQNAFLVGTVAALSGVKDYPNLIKAAEPVIEKRPETFFMAVGSGLLMKEMQNLTKQYGIDRQFIFTGYQEDVGPFIRAFDIFVLASKKEGLGTSVLDAQSIGLPVIGTKSGGIPEMIENEINGLLVPAQNPQALAEAIIRLADDKTLRDKIASKARETVLMFDKSITYQRTLNLYEKLINQRQTI